MTGAHPRKRNTPAGEERRLDQAKLMNFVTDLIATCAQWALNLRRRH
jgi:hypothetical protein